MPTRVLSASPLRPARIAVTLFYALLASAASAEAEFPRLVSLNPSITEIVIALDALPALVGVDDYSARTQPEVAELPRVGGLFNPSLEGIVALEPDLVVLVPSAQQRNLRERLEALGAEVMILENISLGEVLASIELLGERLGRSQAASERVAAIRSAWGAIERDSSTRAPKRAVLVLQRDPIYLVGAGSFLDEMLRVAGVINLAAESFSEPYPRASLEWLIAAAPEFILDSSESATVADQYWKRWPSLPAVQNAHVVTLPTSITRPGPYLDRALDTLTRALHEAERLPMEDTEVGE